MHIVDIRPVKAGLREKYKKIRQAMSPQEKAAYDREITRRVASLWQYKRNKWLFIYVSTPIEVDTRQLIEMALAEGKQVAVPRCIPGTYNMEFYRIESLDDLSRGTFGVLEPEPIPDRLVTRTDGLCIVPALSYDWHGYRLGYGKGYYDRFLTGFKGNMIGICYSSCVQPRLPHGRFDRAVELLVTEKYLRRTARY